MVVERGDGSTETERQLTRLASRSFLKLWSWPNPFRDQKKCGIGAGKELCDLLVICGEYVLIFSDKNIAWPETTDVNLAWSRWFRRSVMNSAAQVNGAERWIREFPDSLYIDAMCTQRLPVQLPPLPNRRVHKIVVARGCGKACIRFFNEGSGSLFIAPRIKGDAHLRMSDEGFMPFAIGDIEPNGNFIHVLDDSTLQVALSELDTISDFTRYLDRKAAFIRSGNLIAAHGEEDLIAHYLQNTDKNGDHSFTARRAGQARSAFTIPGGLYSRYKNNEQYKSKKSADSQSYIWDALIEAFSKHIMAGTILRLPEFGETQLSDHELGIREMALATRTERRAHAVRVLEALNQAQYSPVVMKAAIPSAQDFGRRTGFVLLCMDYRHAPEGTTYDQYRQVRRATLETYSISILERNRYLEKVVGIAFEPPLSPGYAHPVSEDLIYVEQPSNWSESALADMQQKQALLGIMQKGRLKRSTIRVREYPGKVGSRGIEIKADGPERKKKLNRKQRRAMRFQSKPTAETK